MSDSRPTPGPYDRTEPPGRYGDPGFPGYEGSARYGSDPYGPDPYGPDPYGPDPYGSDYGTPRGGYLDPEGPQDRQTRRSARSSERRVSRQMVAVAGFIVAAGLVAGGVTLVSRSGDGSDTTTLVTGAGAQPSTRSGAPTGASSSAATETDDADGDTSDPVADGDTSDPVAGATTSSGRRPTARVTTSPTRPGRTAAPNASSPKVTVPWQQSATRSPATKAPGTSSADTETDPSTTSPPTGSSSTRVTGAPRTSTSTSVSSGSSAPGDSGSYADQVLALTNAQRSANGCRPLTADATLAKVALAHSKDMAAKGYFDHNSQDGRSPFDRMSAAGYSYSLAAENIAAGQRTPQDVVTAWMNSAGHRANILNCKLTELGVGYATGGSYGSYWTQDFGTPR